MDEKFVRFLQRKFLGKVVKVPWVNNTGFGFKRENDYVVGVCKWIGPNPYFPSFGLQVTVGRMPIRNVDYKKIETVDDYAVDNNKH